MKTGSLIMNINTGELRAATGFDRLASFEVWADSTSATIGQLRKMVVEPSRNTSLGKELLYRRTLAGGMSA